jgi:hypothetical protein
MIDSLGRPVIALQHSEGSATQALEVLRFDAEAGDWQSLGKPGNEFSYSARLAELSDGSYAIAWLQVTGGVALFTAQYDGSQWNSLGAIDGTPNATSVMSPNVSMAAGASGLWVTYSKHAQDGHSLLAMELMHFNGTTWDANDVPLAQNGNSNGLGMTLLAGVPVVANVEEVSFPTLLVRRFLASGWEASFDAKPLGAPFKPRLAAGGGAVYVSTVSPGAAPTAELQLLLFP